MILDLNIKVTAFTSCFLSLILIYKNRKSFVLAAFFVCIHLFIIIIIIYLFFFALTRINLYLIKLNFCI